MLNPSNTLSQDWMNENALRAYPLVDDAPATTVVPRWLIADLHVTVDVSVLRVFVSSVYVSDTLISVCISGELSGGRRAGLVSRTVTRDELEPYLSYSMDRMSPLASGTVAFGEVPDGTSPVKRTFGPDDAPVVESAITRVRSPGVTRLVDPAHGTEVTGIVDLSGNSEFRTYADPDDPSTVVLELSDLYREITTSVCSASPSVDACGAEPVRTVCGVPPTEDGTITIRFR